MMCSALRPSVLKINARSVVEREGNVLALRTITEDVHCCWFTGRVETLGLVHLRLELDLLRSSKSSSSISARFLFSCIAGDLPNGLRNGLALHVFLGDWSKISIGSIIVDEVCSSQDSVVVRLNLDGAQLGESLLATRFPVVQNILHCLVVRLVAWSPRIIRRHCTQLQILKLVPPEPIAW